MGLSRAQRTAVIAVAVAVIAAGGTVAARALLDRNARFDAPALTDTQARQAATGLATALDDLAARFLVDDPTTERLQVLHWDDDVEGAASRLADQLGLVGGATAFLRANATELERLRDRATDVDLTLVETRVADATLIGLDNEAADWVRVDIAQDETYLDGETSSSLVSYGVAVRGGAIVDVRDGDGLLARSETSSAGPVVRAFVDAVLAGDERALDRHLADEVSDRELTTLRAWLTAAGDLEVAELPAFQMGSLQVAYVVPQRGPLVRFEVTLGSVTWEIVGAR